MSMSNWKSKLTKEQARQRLIDYQTRLSNGESQSMIARADGISKQAVFHVFNPGKKKK